MKWAAENSADKRFVHPLVGEMTLDCQNLTAENESERLVVFSAEPGSVERGAAADAGRAGRPGQLSPAVEPRSTESAEWSGRRRRSGG